MLLFTFMKGIKKEDTLWKLLIALFVYLHSASKLSDKTIIKMINQLPPVIKEEGLTVAEQLMLKGRRLARLEFEQEKKATIIRMLRIKTLSDGQIAGIANTTVQIVQQIKKEWLKNQN